MIKEIFGPDDGDELPPAPEPLKPGEVEVLDLGEGVTITFIGTSGGDKMVVSSDGGE